MAWVSPFVREVVGRFVVQMVVGTFLFGIVAGVAVLVWLGTQGLEKLGVPYYISGGAEAVAILFFAIDIVSLALFVIAEALKLFRLMWEYVRE